MLHTRIVIGTAVLDIAGKGGEQEFPRRRLERSLSQHVHPYVNELSSSNITHLTPAILFLLRILPLLNLISLGRQATMDMKSLSGA